MSKQGYKKQENLSFLQLLSEVPSFIVDLVSVILSGTLLVFVDFLDSLSYIIRNAMVLSFPRSCPKICDSNTTTALEKSKLFLHYSAMALCFLVCF